MSGAADLQTLLASLKSRSLSSAAGNAQPSQLPSPSSLDQNSFIQSQPTPAPASPSINAPATTSRFNMASPSQPTGAVGGNDRAQTLLNLLKFSQPSAAGNTPQQLGPLSRSASETQAMRQETAHGQSVKVSDLMPSFSGSQNSPGLRDGGNTLVDPPIPSSTWEGTNAPAAGNTAQESSQDALLKLLKRSTSSSTQQKPVEAGRGHDTSFSFDGPPTASFAAANTESQPTTAAHENSSARKASPVRKFGSSQSRDTTPFEPPPTTAARESKPIFTYTNPFDALHASRNATPQPSGPRAGSPALRNPSKAQQGNGDKRKSNETTLEQASTRRKLTPKGRLRSSSSVEHLNGKNSIVGQLDSIAGHASKRVEKPLEEVQIKQEDEDPKGEIDDMADKLQKTTIDAPVQLKQEPGELVNKGMLEEELPKPPVEAVNEIVNDVAAEAVPADSWESSDGPPERTSRDVPVYNFPLKPFVSITIMNLPPSQVGLREDGVMEISRFKKDFDQLDRTLASATSKYITYAFVKNGGMRVIRQDDGSDRQVFKNSGDRIFHVTLCTTSMSAPPTDEQGVLGIGLSGAVYYATISKGGNDLFETDSLDTETLIFPPYPPGDENSSGGTLKTRVRRSSRHPEFFAIGRGKSIHLVWPATAMSTKYGISGSDRTVDIEKFFKDRPLKITTGKAGKDFIFSEDDTLIASLDKTGKLRFWDIRKLVNESNATALKVQAEDVSVPILSLATASPVEKSWPTSVLFVDKIRPYTKGGALRYILVGLKQNHTLQLWDITLGKVVQELNFPHGKETDGICSVAYHPNSGIIVVGNPTRNSIFFLHLSAPRYTLQPMSQATFLERIATRDPELPKPEATACISGMREMSFDSKGQLRSLDLLPVHKPADAPNESVDAQSLFELYIVHSRGVTCLAIKKEDLGWGPDGKVLHPIDANDTGLIKLDGLRRMEPVGDAETNGVAETSQSSKASKRKTTKSTSVDPPPAAAHAKVDPEALLGAPTIAGRAIQPNGVKDSEGNAPSNAIPATPSEKDKKKKKKSGASSILAPSSGQGPEPSKSPSRSLSPSKPLVTAADLSTQAPTSITTGNMASDQPSVPSLVPGSAGGIQENAGADLSGEQFEKEMKKLERSVSAEFNKQLDKLYRRLDDDRNVQDATGASRQEAILRLVASSLATNVENTLNRIIGQHMQQVVLPAITNVTAQAIHAQVGESLARILHGVIPHEISTQLPVAISTAMQNPTHVRALSENISKRLSPSMETHFAELMRTTITPTFQRLAVTAAEKATGEIENRVSAKLQQYELAQQHDAAKIAHLQGSMQAMLEMMGHLTESQIAFQDKILKDRSSLAQLAEAGSRPSSSAATAYRSTPLTTRQISSAQPSPIAPPPKKKTPEEIEIEEIGNLMDEGNYEEGSVKWLQSSRAVELFDQLFINYSPDYLRNEVSPLVAFSVGITVANSFEQNVQARLNWIYTSLNTIDTTDPEMMSLSEHGPALLNSLITKLQTLYSENAGRRGDEPLMQTIRQTIFKAQEVQAQFGQ